MQLDSEQDKALLLEILSAATLKGAAVFAFADLVQRVQHAVIEPSAKGDISAGASVSQNSEGRS